MNLGKISHDLSSHWVDTGNGQAICVNHPISQDDNLDSTDLVCGTINDGLLSPNKMFRLTSMKGINHPKKPIFKN